jgi:hypothetical protein
MDVRATIDKQSDDVTAASESGAVQRRKSPTTSEVHERRIGIEHGADVVDLTER